MSSHGRITGNEPEFRWVIGGKRNRLSLVRRLSLSFELRREEGERQAELWIYSLEFIRRWRISAREVAALNGSRSLAAEMEPLPIWTAADDAPPRWDQGRCVLEATSIARVQDALERGPLAFSLQGERVTGDYRLERTPLAIRGRTQWVIHRDAAAAPAREGR